jgi:hypothetical protein
LYVIVSRYARSKFVLVKRSWAWNGVSDNNIIVSTKESGDEWNGENKRTIPLC